MNLPLSTPPKRICLLRLSAIGDVTHVLPTLRTLQHAWPQTRISWIIGKTEAGLVQDINGVEFIIFDKTRGIKAFYDLRKKLRGYRFDLLFNMQVSPRAALASLLIKAPIKIGYDRTRGKLLHNLVCNQNISHIPHQHVLDSFLEFPKHLGVNTTSIHWDIPIPEASKEKVKKLLGDIDQYIVINPSSSNRTRNWRNWSAQNYAAVIDHTSENFGLKTVLSGGPDVAELAYAAQICALTQSKPLNLVGKTNLKELAALCVGAKLMIAPDTGPIHLANAVGAPVIGLYASSNPERTGPYSHRNLTVNGYTAAIKQEFGKTMNELKWGQRVRNPQAMELIQPQEVIEKLAGAINAKIQNPACSS